MANVRLDEEDFKKLIRGGIVEKGDTRIILSDIGYDRILKEVQLAHREFILKVYK